MTKMVDKVLHASGVEAARMATKAFFFGIPFALVAVALMVLASQGVFEGLVANVLLALASIIGAVFFSVAFMLGLVMAHKARVLRR